MYVATIPNRSSPPALLLRESSREGVKGNTRTLAHLTHGPPAQLDALRRVLHGEALRAPGEAVERIRRLPHGHIAAVLGPGRRLGMETLLASRKSRGRALGLALLVAWVLAPQSKVATARSLETDTAWTRLGQPRGVASADANDLNGARDGLRPRQARSAAPLAKRHLGEGTLALYALPSPSCAGQTGPLAQFGPARDGKKGQGQMGCGRGGHAAGCPVAVEVCEGNPGDPTTLAVPLQKLRHRFPLRRVVLGGDRGLLTDARIRAALPPVTGLEWVTGRRGPAIQALVTAGGLDLADCEQTDRVALPAAASPEERWRACRNPGFAEARARKRDALLHATERALDQRVQATTRGKRRLPGQAQIALRVGKVRKRLRGGQPCPMEIPNEPWRYTRDPHRMTVEAALAGLSGLRTSAPRETRDTVRTVRADKSLATVERACRRLQPVDRPVRPIGHRLAERVRAHGWLGMRAYSVAWHMRQALAPLLGDEDDNAAGEARRASVVAPAPRSPKAQRTAHTQRTAEGWPGHRVRTLLPDCATVTKNRRRFAASTMETPM